jgi:hypothetical protein
LADKDIGSSALAALIAETETAIAAADEAAEAEREKAPDPALCPDANKARLRLRENSSCRTGTNRPSWRGRRR